jgi:hypothetical protein
MIPPIPIVIQSGFRMPPAAGEEDRRLGRARADSPVRGQDQRLAEHLIRVALNEVPLAVGQRDGGAQPVVEEIDALAPVVLR